MTDIANDSVERRVIGILAEHAVMDPSDVTAEATLEQIGMDSLGLIEAIFAIEEAFDIDVPFNANDPQASEFDIRTVGSIARAVEGLIAART